jgi:kynurenine formamidase
LLTATRGWTAWTERQIAGRGVLIDFASYAVAKNLPHKDKIFDQHGISIEYIKAVATEQNVEFQTGDILLIRTGYTQAYAKLSTQEKVDVAAKRSWIGLGQSREAAEWLWERQFAAVGADCPGFETRR